MKQRSRSQSAHAEGAGVCPPHGFAHPLRLSPLRSFSLVSVTAALQRARSPILMASGANCAVMFSERAESTCTRRRARAHASNSRGRAANHQTRCLAGYYGSGGGGDGDGGYQLEDTQLSACTPPCRSRKSRARANRLYLFTRHYLSPNTVLKGTFENA